MIESIKIYGRVFISHSCLAVGDYGGAGSVGHANQRDILDMVDNDKLINLSARYFDHDKTAAHTFVFNRLLHENNYKQYCFDGWRFNQDSYVLDVIAIRNAKVISVYGDYGYRQLWVARNDDELRETVEALEYYPLINDETLGEIEIEWQNEFITDNIDYNFRRAVEKVLAGMVGDRKDDLTEEQAEALAESLTVDDVYEVLHKHDNGQYWHYENQSAFMDANDIADKLVALLIKKEKGTVDNDNQLQLI